MSSSRNFRISPPIWLIAVVILNFYISPLWAAVFKCEDASANIIFSDEPCKKGQSGTKLRWLKNTHTGHKSRKSRVLTQEQKTARKAKKNNQAYVLLSLLTTTKLELETSTLRSSLEGEQSDRPELMLSDGITVDLLDVDKMQIQYKLGEDELRVHFIMHDGYQETQIIKVPFPVLSGEARLGSFSKSLEDIKQIEFFNSAKLRKLRKSRKLHDKNRKQHNKQQKPAQAKADKQIAVKRAVKEKVPVIELDLSNEVSGSKSAPVKEFSNRANKDTGKNRAKNVSKNNSKINQTAINRKSAIQAKIKVLPGNTPASDIPRPLIQSVQGERLPVAFANGKSTFLKRGSLSSHKGGKTAAKGMFILSNKEQISYTRIKSIRVRPTVDQSRLVVAVALKNGEIKMENMSRPFTRIQGRSDKGTFDHSLLEIKSVSF